MESIELNNIDSVIENLYSNKTTIEMELAGIRTDINILLNPDLTEASKDIIKNNELLLILMKILDKSFNSFILTKNFIDVIMVDLKGAFIILNQITNLIYDLMELTSELDNYKELNEVPEVADLKNVVNLEDNLEMLSICYDFLKRSCN